MKCQLCGRPTFSKHSDFCTKCVDMIGARLAETPQIRELFEQTELSLDGVVEKRKPLSS